MPADGDLGSGKGRAVNHRHGGVAYTVGIVAAVICHVDLVCNRINIQTPGPDSHVDGDGVVSRTINHSHRPGTMRTWGAGRIVAATVWNVDFISDRVDHWRVRKRPNSNGFNDSIAHAVNYRHRAAVGLAGGIAASVGDVNLVGSRVHCRPIGKTPNGDGGNDGIARAIDHAHRAAVGLAGGIVAAEVGNVDLVCHRVHRRIVRTSSHIDRDGVVGRPVDDGDRPEACTVGIGTAAIWHVDLVGHRIDRCAVGLYAYRYRRNHLLREGRQRWHCQADNENQQ